MGKKEFIDSRALKSQDGMRLLQELKEGIFRPFVEKVLTSPELEICFRGNSNPESVIIYNRNHKIWELSCTSRGYYAKISFDHARYYRNWQERLEKINVLFKSYDKNYKEKSEPNKEAKIGMLSCNLKGCDVTQVKEFADKSYEIIQPYMDVYFEENPKAEDYFRTAVKLNQTGRNKPNLEEKIMQQHLFSNVLKDMENGYWAYDLEFSQKYESKEQRKTILEETGNKLNEPDMLAIEYKEGQPVALVLLEVKSTEGACIGKSGIVKHYEGMMNYANMEEYQKRRKEEAVQILKQYKELGIYNEMPDYEVVEKMLCEEQQIPVKIAFILTGSAIEKGTQIYKESELLCDFFEYDEEKNILLPISK